MRVGIPEISNQVFNEDLSKILVKNYPIIGPIWVTHQTEWFNSIYASFKNHDKFLILIYLIKKTLDFYSRNFIKLSYNEFYSKDTVEIEKFSVSEISKNISIPKESARRKLIELEKSKAILRDSKKIVIDRSSFPFVKPINSIKRISRFLSIFSKMLVEENILEKQLSSEELEKIIKDNFSLVWKAYYELQIPMLVGYKKIFEDLETSHIYGICVVNEHVFTQINNKSSMNRSEFVEYIFSSDETKGLNAMSISDITGIPRATVVRKLNKLIKKKYLLINHKKHYRVTGLIKKLVPVQDKTFHQLGIFAATIFNFTR
jgi:hypothetical protein